MSKRIRSKSRNLAGDEARIEGGGDAVMAAGVSAEPTEGQSPHRLMLLLWGIPLLILIAAFVVQKFR